MNLSQSVRDRIVGGIFLLSLAGIALPMLFDGAGVARLPDVRVPPGNVTAVPVAPIATTGEPWAFIDESRQLAVDREQRGAKDGDQLSTMGEPQARPPDAKSPLGRELPWTVQVGSFATLASAEALRGKLLKDGFHAYVAQARGTDQRPVARVAVGPIIERGEAERVRDALQQRYGLVVMLKKFDL